MECSRCAKQTSIIKQAIFVYMNIYLSFNFKFPVTIINKFKRVYSQTLLNKLENILLTTVKKKVAGIRGKLVQNGC